MTCATTLPSAPALVYTAAKPRGPVRRNTIDSEVATPTLKRSFVMPKFSGVVRLQHCPYGYGAWWGLPVRMSARLVPCF